MGGTIYTRVSQTVVLVPLGITMQLAWVNIKSLHRHVSAFPSKTVICWYKKGKAIPITGRGRPQGCETSRLPHFLENRLTDGDELVSFKRRTPFTSRKMPGTHFCQRLIRPQGHSAAGRIRSIEKISNDLIGNRTPNLPTFSNVSKPTALPRAHLLLLYFKIDSE
jgi:hypothetical protein